MQKLNFPSYELLIKSRENKLFIFDPIRKKELVLTPEEWVRRHSIQFLLESGYPMGLIGVEKTLNLNNMARRTDILVFDKSGLPFLIVECKSAKVPITQTTFDQIARYNMEIKAPYLMLTNGLNHYFCIMDHKNKSYKFLKELPTY